MRTKTPLHVLRGQVDDLTRAATSIRLQAYGRGIDPAFEAYALSILKEFEAKKAELERREAKAPRIYILDEHAGWRLVGFHRGGHPVAIRRWPQDYTLAEPHRFPSNAWEVRVLRRPKLEIGAFLESDDLPSRSRCKEDTLRVQEWVCDLYPRDPIGNRRPGLYAQAAYDPVEQCWYVGTTGRTLRTNWALDHMPGEPSASRIFPFPG